MSEQQKWVRVKSPSELREGMVLKVIGAEYEDGEPVPENSFMIFRNRGEHLCGHCGRLIAWDCTDGDLLCGEPACWSDTDDTVLRLDTGLSDGVAMYEGLWLYGRAPVKERAE